jgi:hypothetical protein
MPPAFAESLPLWTDTVSCTVGARPDPRSVVARYSRTASLAALPATCGRAAIVRTCWAALVALNSAAAAPAGRTAGVAMDVPAAYPDAARTASAATAARPPGRGRAKARSAASRMHVI